MTPVSGDPISFLRRPITLIKIAFTPSSQKVANGFPPKSIVGTIISLRTGVTLEIQEMAKDHCGGWEDNGLYYGGEACSTL